MKNLFVAAAAAISIAASAVAVQAQDWTPPGPIKLMIAFAAGGGADTQARLIATELENRLGWEFIPEQVTGKGGVNLLNEMKDQPNDGTVIGMIVAESLGYNLYTADIGLTPENFTAITTTAGTQMGIVAGAATGWTSFEDMVAAAKGGQEIRFGVMSQRLGELAYLVGKAQGIDLNIISVKGGRAVLNGVTAGDMDVGFMAGIQAPGVKAGDLVNLASGMAKPLDQTPDAPTLPDLGVDFDGAAIFMFAGPAGMPDDARNAIASAIAEVTSDPETEVGALIARAFGGPLTIQGAELDAMVARDFAESEALIKAASE
ncbi:tripartite tricarboxylate transporter substrate-binding protein [uncultured Sulfitobacter sp.]|uniref:tripartite tricarboxylate transporter substrate-binding protein n=1 Tax=uncultured Sulfitobacter sp. TaxID=191468 RepID=UPI00260C828A|nr:tripartite tricarboxylate transporter substrate-binding protein [uncultured Sulfitobacter sp.]